MNIQRSVRNELSCESYNKLANGASPSEVFDYLYKRAHINQIDIVNTIKEHCTRTAQMDIP